MSDNGHPEHPPGPRIVIEFRGPLQADCDITWDDNVTTGQLYGAAWTLDAVAREFRAAEYASKARTALSGPGALSAALREAGIVVPDMPTGEHKP